MSSVAPFAASAEARQIGDTIRALRTGRKMSQEALAVQAGVSATLVSRVEQGSDVMLSNIYALAAALGVSLDELMHMTWQDCPRCGGSGVVHTTPSQSSKVMPGYAGDPQ